MTVRESALDHGRYKYGPFEEEHFPDAAGNGQLRLRWPVVAVAALFAILLCGVTVYGAGLLLLAAAGA